MYLTSHGTYTLYGKYTVYRIEYTYPVQKRYMLFSVPLCVRVSVVERLSIPPQRHEHLLSVNVIVGSNPPQVVCLEEEKYTFGSLLMFFTWKKTTKKLYSHDGYTNNMAQLL